MVVDLSFEETNAISYVGFCIWKIMSQLILKLDMITVTDMPFSVQGPQYVCTTFLTFVCTNCSGIQ